MNRQRVLEEIVRQLIAILADAMHDHGWYELRGDLDRLQEMIGHDDLLDDQEPQPGPARVREV